MKALARPRVVALLVVAFAVMGGPWPAHADLSAEAAAQLAARLANDECDHHFESRPFRPETYPVAQADGRFTWRRLDPAGVDGFSAEVSFDLEGGDPSVRCYWSSDTNDQPRILDDDTLRDLGILGDE